MPAATPMQQPQCRTMNQSQRKLAGSFLLTASIVVWAVLATGIYLALLVNLPWWAQIIYFAIAGIGWLWPAMALIKWMARPDPR